LDPALMRPGRFEFHLHVPYPNAEDRRAILGIYDANLDLKLSPRALDYAVKRTGDLVEGQATRYSGDHLQALCRALARARLREKREGPLEVDDVEKALSSWAERPTLTPQEERVVATHEAGHAVSALFCPHAPQIERISIRGDLAGALGFVSYSDPAHRYVVTRGQLLDQVCVLFGGREAELLFFEDLSIGSAADIDRATDIARALVEEFGMGGDGLGVRRIQSHHHLTGHVVDPLSEEMKRELERAARAILDEQRSRARGILAEHRALVETLRDLLLARKVLDREALGAVLPKTPKHEAAAKET
jgi:cell division protease FtsH